MDDFVITDAQQVRDWDAATLERDGITSVELMERAARAFVEYFVGRYPLDEYERIDVLCGPGNNGGDGAAIARLLEAVGYTTTVWGWWGSPERRSRDLQVNWERLEAKGHSRLRVNEAYDFSAGPQLVVDALFGVGLDRPLEAPYVDVVRTLNDEAPGTDPDDRAGQRPPRLTVVSVDVPSGQAIDGRSPGWPCVVADRTVTFEAVKLSALFPESGLVWGAVQVTHFGLATPVIVPEGGVGLLTPDDGKAVVAPRRRFNHKGRQGHVLVVGGSRGHGGAALLCGRGAYRAGAGLVTFYAPSRLEVILQLGLPEAMVLLDDDPDRVTAIPDLDPYDVIAVGPGLGRDPRTEEALLRLFAAAGERPVVVDADALNLIAASEQLRAALPPRAILTPHPGEFRRLAGGGDSGRERYELLRAFARGLQSDESAVVLKGQYTAVANRTGDVGFNFFEGNPGMATGGTGDVLTGVIAGCAAQLLEQAENDSERAGVAWDAASIGVLAHARAGNLARDAFGEAGLLAGDVADRVGQAIRSLAERAPGL